MQVNLPTLSSTPSHSHTHQTNKMTPSVTKSSPVLVKPSTPTPSVHLPLSDHIDRTPIMRHFMDIVLVFSPPNDHPSRSRASIVKDALAVVLVDYYPVAGRFAEGGDGKLGIDCGGEGEGVWFVEAKADCSLEKVENLEKEPLLVDKAELLPSVCQGVDASALPIIFQITEFKCGGTVMGIKFNHAFFDGKGIGQFINAVSEISRGLTETTIKPIWCRDILSNPIPNFPSSDHLHLIDFQTKLNFSVLDIPLKHIDKQKEKFEKEMGKKCTTFDIVVAKLWQGRTRVIEMGRDDIVSFTTLVNVRHLHKELPATDGYYGNCLYPIVIEATSKDIADVSLNDVIKIVKSAKESLAENYTKSLAGLGHPPVAQPSYGYLALVDWRRLGLYEADFGWGPPSYLVPVVEHIGSYSIAGIINPPSGMKGTRVATYCVKEEHYDAYMKEMNNWE